MKEILQSIGRATEEMDKINDKLDDFELAQLEYFLDKLYLSNENLIRKQKDGYPQK